MIGRGLLSAVAIAYALAASTMSADERHAMTGVVISVDRRAKTMMVSTDAVPGFMAAIAMPLAVRETAILDGLTPGAAIEFVYVIDGKTAFARDVRVRGNAPLDRKQLEIQRLKVLSDFVATAPRPKPLAVGDRVPDFALIDQQQHRVTMADLAGKVVAMTFGYVRCPDPAYCFRLASNLGQLQRALKDRLGRDLILVTIVLDPQRDRGDALAEYARVWTSQPAAWHFLTGSLPEIQRVAGYFGVQFWKDEGMVLHTLDTVVIDRHGKLAASLEGTEFTGKQLVDVVTGALREP
jgi:protein SCO1/2